jgi:hypothetical protein
MEFKTKAALTEWANDQTVASARRLPNAFSYSHLKNKKSQTCFAGTRTSRSVRGWLSVASDWHLMYLR